MLMYSQVNKPETELSVAPDKVTIVKWHPLAQDILCTVAFDKSVKIWDLNKTENGPQIELEVRFFFCRKKWHIFSRYNALPIKRHTHHCFANLIASLSNTDIDFWYCVLARYFIMLYILL